MDVRRVIPRDAIPSIDAPRFGSTHVGGPDDRVIVVEFEANPTRAYPVRILHYHEIVNDEVDDRSIAVTWCPLCGSAIVYDRVVDDRVLTFGVSGKLANDDLVMYDRETESEWKQSSGACLAGPFAGERLTLQPSSMLTWNRFREEFPDGRVLQPPGGRSEASGPGDDLERIDYTDDPYRDYFAGDGFGLDAHRGVGTREWDRDDIDPKEVVIGIGDGDTAIGVPRSVVIASGGCIRLCVGNRAVVVFAVSDGLHAFENPGFEFEPEPGTDGSYFSADGTRWNGSTGESDDGRRLTRVPARRLFAFAWQDDHGPDSFYT